MAMSVRRLALALLLALGLAGRACADPRSDARAALTKYFAAVKAGDWGSLYDLITQESHGGQSREEFVRTREAGPGAELGKAFQARMTYEVGEVRVAAGGTSASGDVKMRLPDLSGNTGGIPTPAQVAQAPLRDAQRTLQLVVENGAWKVVRPKPQLSQEQQERLQRAAHESAGRPAPAPTPPGKPDPAPAR